ncbi:DUF2062 domain-containing protein [Inquilinus sp. CAU 1745]|uniref:DUF2062 domain-containing protein n=1 Tax=Inquilinus sp. CAU 1745 TaxID=3140369 RepID=UPI00325A9114
MKFLRRHYFRRFLQPINRLRLDPPTVALTVAMGMFWGLTASVGVQVIGVALCWAVARAIDRPFNFPVAIVLTGVTNPLTIPPIYSLYFLSGCAIIPSCHPGVGGIESVIARVAEEGPWNVLLESWQFFGIALLGSLPYAIAATIAGYHIGHWIGERLEKRRRLRGDTRQRSA